MSPMTPISRMSDTELVNKVFERVGMYVGKDATGLAYHAVHDGHMIAGPWGSEQVVRYYALCFLAVHALKEAP